MEVGHERRRTEGAGGWGTRMSKTDPHRYVALTARPRAWASDQEVMAERPNCMVHEADKSPEAIGVLDATGTPIYRVRDAIKMGFTP